MVTRGGQVILVVEDELLVSLTIRYYLERQGYAVRATDSVDEALRLLRETHIDLILADLVLPGCSGVDFAERARDAAPEVLVLHMSAFPPQWLAERYPRLEQDLVMQKPFSETELVARVRAYLTQRQL